MARKSLIARERKRERLVAKYADLRAQLKKEGKWEELDKLPRNSAKGVTFRKMALEGKIPGITKASW